MDSIGVGVNLASETLLGLSAKEESECSKIISTHRHHTAARQVVSELLHFC